MVSLFIALSAVAICVSYDSLFGFKININHIFILFVSL